MSTSWSKNIVLDPTTFGKSPACEILVEMMNADVIPVIEKHRMLSFITDCALSAKHIGTIRHQGVRESTMILVRDSRINRVDNFDYPLKFKTYLKNVITYIFRKNLEEANWTIAMRNH